jgi:exopolyphosphatase/guanosine-5'-triphosphate,3'-diphosphate pyrophosphatase
VDGDMKEGISRPLGAVRLAEIFLRHDPPTPVDLRRMESFIEEKFEPALEQLQPARFDRMIATAATAAAIVSAINRLPRSDRDLIDRARVTSAQVRKLYSELSRMPLAERRKVHGIGPRRAEIIVGGCAVFWRVMESLGQESMYYNSAGVRDGVVVDLAARRVGREASRLTRQQLRVVETMCRKFDVDLNYAGQVALLAGELFDALEPMHRLPPESGRLLQTAGWLHDVGHFISDTGHHKHSAYIVASSDLPGYTERERQVISLLCRYHRKSMPQPRHQPFGDLNAETRKLVMMLVPILRMAVALETSKSQKVNSVECRLQNGNAVMRVRGNDDIDLELWAAERVAGIFREVYGIDMTLEKS